MKVSISWLKELVDLRISVSDLLNLLPLRSVSIKEIKDDSIELDMKGYNRADLLSMHGVAMEVAAITSSKVTFTEPEEAKFVWNQQNLPKVKLEVKNPKLAPVYCVVRIEGLKVASSSPEWARKLEECGIRPVNNIVDVTNLAMLEYGQDMHSFDADKVSNQTLIVRLATNGEQLTTLDGKNRMLSEDDLIIADTKGPIGLAGVMGGKDTEVSDQTTNILLEVTIFDPISIRKTSQRYGLTSEASRRVQHGLTRTNLLKAMDAAIKMYQSLSGKLTAISLVGELEDEVRKITLTKKKLEELVGVRFEDKQVEEYLQKLGFSLATQGQALRGWEATVPYWRLDIELEEDLIEEVARMYGYEKIPAEEVSESEPLQDEDPIFQKIADLRQKLVNLGLTEVQTYSFYSTPVLNALGFDRSSKNGLVKVANPISSETEYLRENLWPNLVEVVGRNLRKGYKDIAIFEIGKTFNNINGNPKEDYRLAIALYNGTDNPLQELYQMVQSLLSHIGSGKLDQSQQPSLVENLFHPNRFVAVEKDGSQIGNLAEVHLRVLNALGIEKRVAVLEVKLRK